MTNAIPYKNMFERDFRVEIIAPAKCAQFSSAQHFIPPANAQVAGAKPIICGIQDLLATTPQGPQEATLSANICSSG